MTLNRQEYHLDTTPNFLGQTPLHLAVIQGNSELTQALLNAGHPIDELDWLCRTPLEYTATLGNIKCAKILISAGADLECHPSSPNGPTFLGGALSEFRRGYILDASNHVQTSFAESAQQALCSSLAEHILSWSSHRSISSLLKVFSYDDITSIVAMVDDINFELVSQSSNEYNMGKQLLHFPWPQEYVEIFLEHGYASVNSKAHDGTTPLMAAAGGGFSSLVQYYIGMNALVNDQDNAGFNSLAHAIRWWVYRAEMDEETNLAHRRKEFGYLKTVKLLLQAGACVSTTDHCRCPCSKDGCTAIHHFYCPFPTTTIPRFDSGGPFVATEWLSLLDELGREEDLRESLITFIRRSRFEELQLHHTCCRGYGGAAKLFPTTTQSSHMHVDLDAEMKAIEGLGMKELRTKWLHQISKSYDSHLSRNGLPSWIEVLDLYKSRQRLPVSCLQCLKCSRAFSSQARAN